MNADTDRLIHILLCEELGPRAIPDLSQRVVERAFPRRRRGWLRAVAVAAAAVVVCGVILQQWAASRRYPAPAASGPYTLHGAAAVGRGAVLATDDKPASLTLGGYCTVRLQPYSSLRIQGQDRREAVFLERGTVQCDVTPGRGAFAVQSPLGLVSVVGTSFSVSLLERPGGKTAGNKRPTAVALRVAVTAGAVSVDYGGRSFRLTAGSQQVFDQQPPAATHPSNPPHGTEKVTITGTARSLGAAGGKHDPSVANATLTVTTGGKQVVYYVYGWAGVILAQQADGKKAEVSGVVAKKNGRKTITGKSMDVKIIVVEEGK